MGCTLSRNETNTWLDGNSSISQSMSTCPSSGTIPRSNNHPSSSSSTNGILPTTSESLTDPIEMKLSKMGSDISKASKFHRDNLLEDFDDLKFDRKDIPVKIIFGEPTGNKFYQKVISSVLRKEYGLLHLAVQVGPLVLHWVNCSLVMISVAKSEKADLALELGSITMNNDTFEKNVQIMNVLDKISEYNRHRKYDLNTCNCQTFVKEILALLNINFDSIFSCKSNREEMSNHLEMNHDKNIIKGLHTPKEYLDYLKTHGTHPPNPFRSHEELDSILNTFMSCHPDMKNQIRFQRIETFQKLYPAEYLMLKGYDRIFWMKYNNCITNIQRIEAKHRIEDKQENDKDIDEVIRDKEECKKSGYIQLIPQYCQCKCSCPFGDPHFTGSSVLPTDFKTDIDSYGL
jgi:hypothetical protein